ncbi:hypothetical protein Agub_g13580 [Astrephomene gubernaculifera]|uniref:C962R-like N-terminal AEP domain-containing protein n=1 Tax=Astrephomene gubernaculifera TaxID=47775 RepID=A0AAD3E1Q2_9CHLO|nr:hypothetical protein Agub_g13580 [Astrephomene gubernaculifera]
MSLLLQHRYHGLPTSRHVVSAEGAPFRLRPVVVRSPTSHSSLRSLPDGAQAVSAVQQQEQQNRDQHLPESSSSLSAPHSEEAIHEDACRPGTSTSAITHQTRHSSGSPDSSSIPSLLPPAENPSPSSSTTSTPTGSNASSSPSPSSSPNSSSTASGQPQFKPRNARYPGVSYNRNKPQHQHQHQQHSNKYGQQHQPYNQYSNRTDGPSTSGSRTSWPAAAASSSSSPQQQQQQLSPPPYARAMAYLPRTLLQLQFQQQPLRQRPAFLEAYPVPPGKNYNINSFLGKRDLHGGQYLVPQSAYQSFVESYFEALQEGYQLFLTENYHQQVYKYFVELDWDWDTDLDLVMEVTPKLMQLVAQVAGDFYKYKYPSSVTSIRTPYRIHLNYPKLITTELLAHLCRDRILEACRTQLSQYSVDWERLIDFPHGSLRLMGSRKGHYMDSDPAWVLEKSYYPAKLMDDGKWHPGRLTTQLLMAASIFPGPQQVAEFERSSAYLDVVFGDMAAYKKKIEERQLRRQQQQSSSSSSAAAPPVSGSSGVLPQLPPGSSKYPLYVKLQVQPDETVSLNIHVKSRFRTKNKQAFVDGGQVASQQQLQQQQGPPFSQPLSTIETPSVEGTPEQQQQQEQQRLPAAGSCCEQPAPEQETAAEPARHHVGVVSGLGETPTGVLLPETLPVPAEPASTATAAAALEATPAGVTAAGASATAAEAAPAAPAAPAGAASQQPLSTGGCCCPSDAPQLPPHGGAPAAAASQCSSSADDAVLQQQQQQTQTQSEAAPAGQSPSIHPT